MINANLISLCFRYCNFDLTDPRGLITSPNYPNNYPAPIVCTYRITPPRGRIVSLSISNIDLGLNDTNLCNGRLVIYNGEDVSAPPMATLRGTHYFIPSRVINSTVNALFLRLETCASCQDNMGFHALYNTIDLKCGGLFKENNGTIRHPATNGTLYNNNEDCTWAIQAPPGQAIKLDFYRFDTELNHDYIIVTEMYAGQIINLGTFSGPTRPPSITTQGRIMYIKFYSDSSSTRTGFIANYVFVNASRVN